MEKEEKKVEEKEEKKVEEKKEMSKGFKIFIIVAMIILTILIFIFAFNLGRNIANFEENVVNNDDKEKEENIPPVLTKDSKVVTDLFAIYTEADNGMYGVDEDYDLSKVNVRKSLVFSLLRENGKTSKRTCGSLSVFNVGEYLCSTNLIYNDSEELDYQKMKEVNKNDETITFEPEEFKAKYLELFGQNAEYKDESFEITDLPGGYAYFDEKNNLYAHFVYVTGGVAAPATHVLDSIEQNGTSLNLFTTLIVEDANINSKITYTFEYEKETGNYIFVSREEK